VTASVCGLLKPVSAGALEAVENTEYRQVRGDGLVIALSMTLLTAESIATPSKAESLAGKGRSCFELTLLCIATALTRCAFRSRYLYDVDSVNFALALGRFDPAVHQPHPPGYFLYVLLGRLLNGVIHEPNTAFVAISIAASCGAAATIALLTREWFGIKAARCAALLFVFSPLAWFHGTVALTYIVEAFFSSLTGYLCWKKSLGRAGFVLGLAAGFRPSSLLFLGPLWLFSLRGARRHRQWQSAAMLAVTVLAWAVPMILLSGGASAWLSSLASLWNTVPGKTTFVNSSIANSAARLLTICLIYGLCFGCAAALPFVKRPNLARGAVPGLRVFALIWILPGLLFFTFVFLKFVNSGYLLVVSPPAFAWLGLLASNRAGFSNRRVRVALTGACLGINTLILLFAPVYCSWSATRQFERELAAVLIALPKVASSRDTVIVGLDSHFMGYRHAAFYLPDYETIQYPRVRLGSGWRVFTVKNRATTLREIPSLAPYKRFIFFPLPRVGSDYGAYMQNIESKFAPGELRHLTVDGLVFVTGSVTSLPVLFAGKDR
jgi:hypothetical protein